MADYFSNLKTGWMSDLNGVYSNDQTLGDVSNSAKIGLKSLVFSLTEIY